MKLNIRKLNNTDKAEDHREKLPKQGRLLSAVLIFFCNFINLHFIIHCLLYYFLMLKAKSVIFFYSFVKICNI